MVELFFRLFPGSIRSPQVVEFLSHRLRHIPGKLLVVWDGLRSHRGRLVWDFVCQQRGRIGLEFLPACAPQLNPVEYLWSHWKQHELPNFCPKNFGELSHYARKALWRMRRRSTRPASPGTACVAGFAGPKSVVTPMAVDKSEGVVKDKNVLSGVCDTACSPEKVEDQDSGISR